MTEGTTESSTIKRLQNYQNDPKTVRLSTSPFVQICECDNTNVSLDENPPPQHEQNAVNQ